VWYYEHLFEFPVPFPRFANPRLEREQSSVTPPDGLTSISFTDRVNRLNAGLLRDGIPVSDMRRAPALELQFAGAGELGRSQGMARSAGIEPLEGPIAAVRVPPIPPRESRLRYFLDGAQRTFAVWRCGLVPTAATVVVAGILRRDPGEDGSVVPGTLRMEHCWLIPRNTGDHRVEELLRRIDEEGMRVVDPREAERRATHLQAWSSSSATRIYRGRKRRRCSVCHRDTARRRFSRLTIAAGAGRTRSSGHSGTSGSGTPPGWTPDTPWCASRHRALFAPPRRSTASLAGSSLNERLAQLEIVAGRRCSIQCICWSGFSSDDSTPTPAVGREPDR
jgi:hypothetical protein